MIWIVVLAVVVAWALVKVVAFVSDSLHWSDLWETLTLGSFPRLYTV